MIPQAKSNEQVRPPRPPEERMERGPPELKERIERGPQEPKELKLHSALEKVLAFKDVRAQEVGLTPEELEQLNMPESKSLESIPDYLMYTKNFI